MRVYNMVSSNGNKVPNQFVIDTDNGVYMQSYNSMVVHWGKNGVLEFGKDWDYSKTTMKYVKWFLESNGIWLHSASDIRKAIKEGYARTGLGLVVVTFGTIS